MTFHRALQRWTGIRPTWKDYFHQYNNEADVDQHGVEHVLEVGSQVFGEIGEFEDTAQVTDDVDDQGIGNHDHERACHLEDVEKDEFDKVVFADWVLVQVVGEFGEAVNAVIGNGGIAIALQKMAGAFNRDLNE